MMAEPIEFDLTSSTDDAEERATLDNTCPDCGTESVISYIDRHSGYEYCTDCEWSDQDADGPVVEPFGRPDRLREEA